MTQWLIGHIDALTHLGIYALIMYMMFVIVMVCRESGVPTRYMIWPFIGLGGGFTGWIVKDIIQWILQ